MELTLQSSNTWYGVDITKQQHLIWSWHYKAATPGHMHLTVIKQYDILEYILSVSSW